jgi:hypothetical protein
MKKALKSIPSVYTNSENAIAAKGMKMLCRLHKMIAVLALTIPAGGCSRAPALDIAGSFLPSWMFCLLGGLLAAGLVHWQLLRRRLQGRVEPVVVFYPSVAVAVACLLWLLFFR